MEGQVAAAVYRTVVRYKAIEGRNSPSFRFSCFLNVTSLTIDQYCETIALSIPCGSKRLEQVSAQQWSLGKC